MPTRWETFPVELQGGLISNLSDIKHGIQQPGSARKLINFEPSIEGGYRRINGFTKFDPTEVTGSGQVWGVGILDNAVIAARNGNIYESTGGGWNSIASGRTHTTKHRFHAFNLDGTRKIIGVDGVNYPYSWDGTTFTNINGSTDVQATRHVVEFKNHIFYSKGDLVTFSAPFDETDFTPANGAGNFRVEAAVTGMAVFRSSLIVFTERSIHQLSGSSSSDFTLTSISDDVGCTREDTIQEVAGDIAFFSLDGVRLLGATDRIGDFSNALASRQIQKEMNELNDIYTSFSSVVVRGKSQYRLLGFASGRDKETTQGYVGTQFEAQNSDSFRWGELVGIKAYSADSKVFDGDEIIVFCGEDDGYVYRMEQGDDFDGTTIESSFFTPYLSFNDLTSRKTLYKITMYFNPEGSVEGSLSTRYDLGDQSIISPPSSSFSGGGGGSLYGQAIYGQSTYQGGSTVTFKQHLTGSGFNASFELQFTAAAPPFVLDTLAIEFANNERF